MLTRRAFTLGACATAGCASMPAADPISDDEYILFSLLLSDFECREDNVYHYLERETDSRLLNPDGRISLDVTPVLQATGLLDAKVLRELQSDLVRANRTSPQIDTSKLLPSCVEFVSSEEAAEIRKHLDYGEALDAWRQELSEKRRRGDHTRTPDPFMRRINRVSRFGFDKARQFAVGEVSGYCGPLCADVYYYFAKRHLGSWIFVHRELLLIS